MSQYFKGIKNATKTLATGLKVTMKEYFTPKSTEQYPTAEPLFLTAYLIPQSAVPEIITLFTYLGEITFLES